MVEQVADVLRSGRRFLVTMHRRPDGDAVGSSLALVAALRAMGKDVVHYCADPLPFNLRFLPGAESVVHQPPTGPFDATIVCDCKSIEDVGGGIPPCHEEAGVLIRIDHHEGGHDGDVSLVDPEAAAAAVLVYRLLRHMRHSLCQKVASNLFAAIQSDTGSFRYDSTDPEALRICAELVEHGVRPWSLSSRLFETFPIERQRLLALVLATLEVIEAGRLAILTASLEARRSCGCGDELLEGFINYGRSIDGVEVALMFVEVHGGDYEAFFRSRGSVDLTPLRDLLGAKASRHGASARLTGDLQDVKQRATGAVGHLL